MRKSDLQLGVWYAVRDGHGDVRRFKLDRISDGLAHFRPASTLPGARGTVSGLKRIVAPWEGFRAATERTKDARRRLEQSLNDAGLPAVVRANPDGTVQITADSAVAEALIHAVKMADPSA
jgi:hypothetical protein